MHLDFQSVIIKYTYDINIWVNNNTYINNNNNLSFITAGTCNPTVKKMKSYILND